MRPWFTALGIPFEGVISVDMDEEGEWIAEWTVPLHTKLEMHPMTLEEWQQNSIY